MAITNYAELQAAVGNWLARSDLTARIPEFITMGEARIGRELRPRAQQSVTTDTIASGVVAVPSDYLEMVSVNILDSGNYKPLDYMNFDQLTHQYQSSTGTPKHYSIVGTSLYFGPTENGLTVRIVYYRRLVALGSSPSGSAAIVRYILDKAVLFDNNPDLYVYAALTYATPYLHNDARIPIWEQGYRDIKEQINVMEKVSQRGASMKVSLG
jgi:hypothetical protein